MILSAAAKKKRVLIVDDDSLLLWALKRSFESEGFEVKGYETAEEALEQIKGLHFDLAILDIRLPGINGISLLEEVKKGEICDQFIVISGFYDKPPLEEKNYNLSFFQFVSKPFRMEEIKDLARKVV